jgi:hypothetical protein
VRWLVPLTGRGGSCMGERAVELAPARDRHRAGRNRPRVQRTPRRMRNHNRAF